MRRKLRCLGLLTGSLQQSDAEGVAQLFECRVLESPWGGAANWVTCGHGWQGAGWGASLGLLQTQIPGCSQAVLCCGWQVLQNATGVTENDALQLQLWP